MNVLVAMASHNRRDSTLACLAALSEQLLPTDVRVRVSLVDSGSTDGTVAAVRERFPGVQVTEGDPGWYWTEATTQAVSRALDADVTHVMLLNDDTYLYAGAVALLSGDLQRVGGRAIISGATESAPGEADDTYGGKDGRRWLPTLVRQVRLDPGVPRKVSTVNGNAVLFPVAAWHDVGLDRRFPHQMADMDFGFRANAAGFPTYLSSQYVGVCARNDPPNWKASTVTLKTRVVSAVGVKQRPLGPWFRFTRKHGGPLWVLHFIYPYVRALSARPRIGRRGG